MGENVIVFLLPGGNFCFPRLCSDGNLCAKAVRGVQHYVVIVLPRKVLPLRDRHDVVYLASGIGVANTLPK